MENVQYLTGRHVYTKRQVGSDNAALTSLSAADGGKI
jgi:hypothetical protein